MLAFVPSVLCDFRRQQLRELDQAVPVLAARGAQVLAISTDCSSGWLLPGERARR